MLHPESCSRFQKSSRLSCNTSLYAVISEGQATFTVAVLAIVYYTVGVASPLSKSSQ